MPGRGSRRNPLPRNSPPQPSPASEGGSPSRRGRMPVSPSPAPREREGPALKAREGEGVYDVTAISFHAYPYIQDSYALMPCGGSVGDGYGPMIVATQGFSPSEVKHKKIAIPGTLTTAYLALRLFAPHPHLP